MNARQRWAAALIDRPMKPIPRYGSPEWLALPEGSAAKVAAVVVAAECWAREGDEVRARLQAEVETLAASFKATEDELYLARRDAHRAEWQHLPAQVARSDRARKSRLRLVGGDVA